MSDRLRALPSVDRLATAVARAELADAARSCSRARTTTRTWSPARGSDCGRRCGGCSTRRASSCTRTSGGRRWPAAARAAVARVATGYSNLELDLERGERGSRHAHVEALLRELTGAEAALAVNNCAAAVLLAVAALAGGERERDRLARAARSRSAAASGSRRWSRRRARGWSRSARPTGRGSPTTRRRSGRTRAPILRAHPSNFRTLGFVEEVGGRGAVRPRRAGHRRRRLRRARRELEVLADEPPVRRSVRAGAAVVVLLRRQAAGRPAGRDPRRAARRDRRRAARHPLARAVRIDKLSLAALEATLALYRDPGARPARDPGAGDARRAEPAELRARAERLAAATGGERRRGGRRSAAARCRCSSCPARWSRSSLARAAPSAGRARCARGDPPSSAASSAAAAARPAHAHRRGGRRRRRRGGRSARMTAAPLTLGTAGHIDHGKTALVGRSPGTDTDRLPEERERGISIALGYARLDAARRPARCPSSTCRGTSASCGRWSRARRGSTCS